jgi:hypothetical protein
MLKPIRLKKISVLTLACLLLVALIWPAAAPAEEDRGFSILYTGAIRGCIDPIQS